MNINTLLTYYHTIKYLKPKQVLGQLRQRFRQPIRLKRRPAPPTRALQQCYQAPIFKKIAPLDQEQLQFLNQRRSIASAFVWTDPSIPKLWLYHLHYFDVLTNAPANDTSAWQTQLINRWLQENPPAQGVGWEPYPCSLRIVNWIKWCYQGHDADPAMLQSLAYQVRHLTNNIEHHLLANHLLANAKALIYAGLFFTGKEANRWFNKGLKLFKQELHEQILADGGHFELSPMYHAIILEDILDIINLYQAHHLTLPRTWLTKITQMLHWLQHLSHPDQGIAFFNDAALGVAPPLFDLLAYATRLGIELPPPCPEAVLDFASSGYCRVNKDQMALIVDMAAIGASYQPGHAHADTLSFELSLQQQRVIVNSGTSCYEAHPERERQRATSAHNTVVINDRNSSTVWKSFRVARRAHILDRQVRKTASSVILSASHDGYYHTDKVIHTRRWIITDQQLIISDLLIGSGTPKIAIYLHFHPTIELEPLTEQCLLLRTRQGQLLARMTTDQPLIILNSTYHPEFNVSIANKKCVITATTALPAQFTTTLSWKH